MLLAIGPHDDDLELFAAFSLMNHEGPVQPLIAFDGMVQADRGLAVRWEWRAIETGSALSCLGIERRPHRLHIPDNASPGTYKHLLVERLELFRLRNPSNHVIFPAAEQGGHPQHNVLSEICSKLWPNGTRYLTYANGNKSTSGKLVMPKDGKMIARKLRALSCHESQMNLDSRMGCWPHFLRGLEEYIL